MLLMCNFNEELMCHKDAFQMTLMSTLINLFVGKLGSAARVDERENKLEIEVCER